MHIGTLVYEFYIFGENFEYYLAKVGSSDRCFRSLAQKSTRILF